MQKVMNQGINRDHAAADLGPEDHFLGSAEQEGGQGHGEDLVRDTVDLPQRLEECRRHSSQPVSARRTVGRPTDNFQACVRSAAMLAAICLLASPPP